MHYSDPYLSSSSDNASIIANFYIFIGAEFPINMSKFLSMGASRLHYSISKRSIGADLIIAEPQIISSMGASHISSIISLGEADLFADRLAVF